MAIMSFVVDIKEDVKVDPLREALGTTKQRLQDEKSSRAPLRDEKSSGGLIQDEKSARAPLRDEKPTEDVKAALIKTISNPPARIPDGYSNIIAIENDPIGMNDLNAADRILKFLRGKGVDAISDSFMRFAIETAAILLNVPVAANDGKTIELSGSFGQTFGELRERIQRTMAHCGRAPLARKTIARIISCLVGGDFSERADDRTLIRPISERLSDLAPRWHYIVRNTVGKRIWVNAMEQERRRRPGTIFVLFGVSTIEETLYIQSFGGRVYCAYEVPSDLGRQTFDLSPAPVPVPCLVKDVLRIVFSYFPQSEAYVLELCLMPTYPGLNGVASVKPLHDFMLGVTESSSALWNICMNTVAATAGWSAALDVLLSGELCHAPNTNLRTALIHGNIPAARRLFDAQLTSGDSETSDVYRNLVTIATASDNKESLIWALKHQSMMPPGFSHASSGRQPERMALYAFGLAARIGVKVSLECVNEILIGGDGATPEAYRDAAEAAKRFGQFETAELIERMIACAKEFSRLTTCTRKVKKSADAELQDDKTDVIWTGSDFLPDQPFAFAEIDETRIDESQFDKELLDEDEDKYDLDRTAEWVLQGQIDAPEAMVKDMSRTGQRWPRAAHL